MSRRKVKYRRSGLPPEVHALWNEVLGEIPGIFARLAFLASLRDEAMGRYSYFRLKPLVSDDAVDRFLRQQHHAAFKEWLVLPLARRRADFERFLASPHGHRRQILTVCAVLTPPGWYAPLDIEEHEWMLHISDLAVIFGPMLVEYGFSAGERKPATALKVVTDYYALW